MHSHTDFKVFDKNFNDKKTQLIWKTLNSDLYTPVLIWKRICEDEHYSFLLESVEGGKNLGRYSVIGLKPDLFWKTDIENSFTSVDGISWDLTEQEPLSALKTILQECHIDIKPSDFPPMAGSGLYGYFGYNTITLIEDIPDNHSSEFNIPDAFMFRPTLVIIFDNIKNIIHLVTPIHYHAGNSDQDSKEIYNQCMNEINNIIQKFNSTSLLKSYISTLSLPLEIKHETKESSFKHKVDQAIKYIEQGEIFQVVLSQRFTADFDIHPFEMYRALRSVNPSPFMFYLQLSDFSLIGSSPEILVRVRDNNITIRPIAGTRKRGKDEAEDLELMKELKSDPKENAEHLMLLDLARNDVGSVADIGSVHVTEKFGIELYSHVMHIVSNVEGHLSSKHDAIDAFFAGFPAGTVTGAPKIRAMQIIEELEDQRRCFYAGSVGYFDGNGDLDTCITLRTALIKDNKIYIQAGAGIVANSIPENEHQECLNKAKAIFQAAENALQNNQN
jgi:anthranilate synthase component 1